jgi:hypothetical protein
MTGTVPSTAGSEVKRMMNTEEKLEAIALASATYHKDKDAWVGLLKGHEDRETLYINTISLLVIMMGKIFSEAGIDVDETFTQIRDMVLQEEL